MKDFKRGDKVTSAHKKGLTGEVIDVIRLVHMSGPIDKNTVMNDRPYDEFYHVRWEDGEYTEYRGFILELAAEV